MGIVNPRVGSHFFLDERMSAEHPAMPRVRGNSHAFMCMRVVLNAALVQAVNGSIELDGFRGSERGGLPYATCQCSPESPHSHAD